MIGPKRWTCAREATPRERAYRLGWVVQPANHSSVQYAWSMHNATESLMTQLDEQAANVRYIPSSWFFDRLCDPVSGLCGPTAPGTNTVIYFDSHHFSLAGSMYLAPFLSCKMQALGLLNGMDAPGPPPLPPPPTPPLVAPSS